MAACASLGPPYGHGVLGGAMYLLVIGLVAVIVAFLVAAFFSMRRGHDDEDEPARRPSVRDRIRGRGDDGHDRTTGGTRRGGRGSHGPRAPALGPWPGRVPAGRAGTRRDPGRADHYEPAGYDQPRGYEPSPRGYGERRPGARLRRAARRASPEPPRRAASTTAPRRVCRSARPARRRAGHAGPRGARRRQLRHRAGGRAVRHRAGRGGRMTPPGRSTPTPTWPIPTCSRGSGRTFHRPASKPAANQPKPARRPAVCAASMTTTMTGPAPSGTSCPTSSTGPNCPRTSHWLPPRAARSPAARRPRREARAAAAAAGPAAPRPGRDRAPAALDRTGQGRRRAATWPGRRMPPSTSMRPRPAGPVGGHPRPGPAVPGRPRPPDRDGRAAGRAPGRPRRAVRRGHDYERDPADAGRVTRSAPTADRPCSAPARPPAAARGGSAPARSAPGRSARLTPPRAGPTARPGSRRRPADQPGILP